MTPNDTPLRAGVIGLGLRGTLAQEAHRPEQNVHGVAASDIVCYQQCHFTPDAWRNYTVIGTEGRLENIGYETIRLWNRRQDKYWDGDLDVTSNYDSSGHGGADTLMMSEFLQYVRAGAPTRNSPVTARYAVATTEAATESLRSDGAPMDVPGLPPNIAAAFSGLGTTPIPSEA